MKYIFTIFLLIFYSQVHAQEFLNDISDIETRNDILRSFQVDKSKQAFPICPFQVSTNLKENVSSLKLILNELSLWASGLDRIENFIMDLKANEASLLKLVAELEAQTDSLAEEVKRVDLSGTADANLHLSSYCATSELLTEMRNTNYVIGAINLLQSTLDPLSLNFKATPSRDREDEFYKIKQVTDSLKSALNGIQRTTSAAFKNDIHFMSYLRSKDHLSKFDFKLYKNHFKKVKKISQRQLKEFDKKIRELSKEEKKAFTELLKSQKDGYIKLGHMNEMKRRKLLNTLVVFSNLTWGLPNTLIGLTVVGIGAIAAPFSSQLDMPYFEKSESGKQITINVNNLFMFNSNVSFGLFQLKSNMEGADHHEGGHAVQSAVLGPLYLPLVIADYIAEKSISDNRIETNADRNAERIPGKLTLEELMGEYYY